MTGICYHKIYIPFIYIKFVFILVIKKSGLTSPDNLFFYFFLYYLLASSFISIPSAYLYKGPKLLHAL